MLIRADFCTCKLFLLTLFCFLPRAWAQTNCGPQDPGFDFFGNFDNSCYVVALSAGTGTSLGGDTNARYELIHFKVDPRYELILYATFPNARYYSITVYDDHDAQLSTLTDMNFKPLTSSDINPFSGRTSFRPGQRYAMAVNLGGKQVTNPGAGCSLGSYAVYPNQIAGTGRHLGMSWNGDPNVPRSFPQHKDVPSNAGSIIIRRYLEDSSENVTAKLLVRDVTTGCAVPAQQARDVIVTLDSNLYHRWKDVDQADTHLKYSTSVQVPMCYSAEPDNALLWVRNPEYIPGINTDAAYLSAAVPSNVIRDISGLVPKKFLRIRTRLPSTPAYPCPSCAFTGSEQLRYFSLSFMNGATALISLSDRDFVRDAQGYITLIVGAGAQPPSFVTAANGYTYLDLSKFKNYRSLNALNIRSILPSGTFSCAVNRIPYLTAQYDSAGGYMGEYAPMADLVDGSSLSNPAPPLVRPETCSLQQVPGETDCSVFYPQPLWRGFLGLLL
jgi:hypothetical protein